MQATGLRCYPDVSVYCGELKYDPEDSQSETATNPTIIFEVLSKSTEGYDRGTKAQSFRKIESLQAYVFVAQTSANVEVFRREADGDWKLHETTGLDASVVIPGIGVTLPMAEIYDRVVFPETEEYEEEPERRI